MNRSQPPSPTISDRPIRRRRGRAKLDANSTGVFDASVFCCLLEIPRSSDNICTEKAQRLQRSWDPVGGTEISFVPNRKPSVYAYKIKRNDLQPTGLKSELRCALIGA